MFFCATLVFNWRKSKCQNSKFRRQDRILPSLYLRKNLIQKNLKIRGIQSMISTCIPMHSHVCFQSFYLLCHNVQTFVIRVTKLWYLEFKKKNLQQNLQIVKKLSNWLGISIWNCMHCAPFHTWSIDMCSNVCHWHSTFKVNFCWFESITFKLRDNLYNLRYTTHTNAYARTDMSAKQTDIIAPAQFERKQKVSFVHNLFWFQLYAYIWRRFATKISIQSHCAEYKDQFWFRRPEM